MIECPQCDASFESFKACNQHINSKHKVKAPPKPAKAPLKFVNNYESDSSSDDNKSVVDKSLTASLIKKSLKSLPFSNRVSSSESDSEPKITLKANTEYKAVINSKQHTSSSESDREIFNQNKKDPIKLVNSSSAAEITKKPSKNLTQKPKSYDSDSEESVTPKKPTPTAPELINYRCPTCHATFSSSDLLKKHSISKHDNEIVGPISRYQIKVDSNFNRPKVSALRALIRECVIFSF